PALQIPGPCPSGELRSDRPRRRGLGIGRRARQSRWVRRLGHRQTRAPGPPRLAPPLGRTAAAWRRRAARGPLRGRRWARPGWAGRRWLVGGQRRGVPRLQPLAVDRLALRPLFFFEQPLGY